MVIPCQVILLLLIKEVFLCTVELFIRLEILLTGNCILEKNNTDYSGDRSYMTEIYKAREKIAYGYKWKVVE